MRKTTKMKINTRYKTSKFLLILAGLLMTAVCISAQTSAFSYQGRLSSGGNPASGTYEMQFQLFDTVKGGVQIGATFTDANVAVSNGVFTTTLDFGAAAFDGSARFLETGVRTAGSPDPFTILSPRQAINSTPYAIQAKNASQLGGVDSKQFLQTNGSGASLTGVVKSVNTLTDDVTLAAGNNIKITPAGNTLTIESTSGGVGGSGTTNSIPFWSNGTTLGNSQITQNANGVQLPNGVQMAVGAQGYQVAIGSPNGETGITIAGPAASSRADLRFDGVNNKLRLVVGAAGGPPINGLSIDTSGNVGVKTTTPLSALDIGATGDGAELLRFSTERPWIFKQVRTGASAGLQLFSTSGLKKFEITTSDGFNVATFLADSTTSKVGIGTTDPVTRLTLSGGPQWTSNLWTASMNLQNASALGWEANGSGQHFGIGQSTGGLYFFRANSVFGNTSAPANYDLQISDTGNLIQPLARNGVLKASALVRVVRDCFGTSCNTLTPIFVNCFNSVTNSTTGTCGFSFPAVFANGVDIDFGFQINNHFISLTAGVGAGSASVATFVGTNRISIANGNFATSEFYIFIF